MSRALFAVLLTLAAGITLLYGPLLLRRMEPPAEPGIGNRDWLAAQISISGCNDYWPPELLAVLMGKPRPDCDRDPRGCIAWDVTAEARLRYLKADALLLEKKRVRKKEKP